MPEGYIGAPRLTNIGPISRSTEEEIRQQWEECPPKGKPNKICKEIKRISIAILENQGFFAECDDLIDINSGNCVRVAERIFEIVEGVRVMEAGDGDHVWIMYNSKHYDAEVPTGVDDWTNLPFFGRIPLQNVMMHMEFAPDLERPENPRDVTRDVTEEFKQR